MVLKRFGVWVFGEKTGITTSHWPISQRQDCKCITFNLFVPLLTYVKDLIASSTTVYTVNVNLFGLKFLDEHCSCGE